MGVNIKTNIVLGHCIFNMNSRAPGIAIWEGVVEPLYHMIKESKYWVLQLPCPETSYINIRRWWFVYEQYDNPHYRKLCKQLAIAIAEILLENNIREFKLIGLGLSPSCGCREIQSDPTWGGKPREVDVKANIKPGKGVWIETLESVFSNYGFDFKLYDISPAIIYPKGRAECTKLYPKNMVDSLKDLATELGFDLSKLRINEYLIKESITEDQRSGKVLVIPQEVLLKWDIFLDEYISKGYGLISIPYSKVVNYDRLVLLEEVINQIKNHIGVGHKVVVYNREFRSGLYKVLIKMITEEGLSIRWV
jgi:predicted secreted protein